MKTTLLIFGLLITTVLTYGQTVSASDYFMFKKDVKYYYKALGLDGTNKVPEMSYHCFGVKNNNGKIEGMFYFNTQYGWQTQEVYKSSGNTIQKTYSKNSFGGGDINPPNPIFKLPESSEKIKWSWGDSNYSAQYLTSIKIKDDTYNDLVVVTEGSDPEYEMGTTKKFYAKGIGLVKIEFYDENEELVEFMSFDLVKYE